MNKYKVIGIGLISLPLLLAIGMGLFWEPSRPISIALVILIGTMTSVLSGLYLLDKSKQETRK